VKEGIYYNYYPSYMFLPLAVEDLGCLHQQSNNFSIDVITWHGQQRALKALLYWFYIPFIDKECQKRFKKHKPSLFQGRLLREGSLCLEFYEVYFPFL
jgi:hypothetical protein